jgi:hypothetical protein
MAAEMFFLIGDNLFAISSIGRHTVRDPQSRLGLTLLGGIMIG